MDDLSKRDRTICIRFRRGALGATTVRARIVGLQRASWIRTQALGRASRILAGEVCSPLTFETAHGIGESVAIRLTADEHNRVATAALKEGAVPGTWMRAVCMAELGSF